MVEMARITEEKERVPCLGEGEAGGDGMVSQQRRCVALDALLAFWGLGAWLGVNGLYVQLPLLVQALPEGWSLPSAMALAVQLANVGLLAYAALRRLLPRAPDATYIYGLLTIGTLALLLNSFLYTATTPLAGADRSVAFLTLTFFAALVGCTSSVLFYPYLRHFREVYLATYLAGEGLSGFIPSILALVQGVGGEPECVPSTDAATLIPVHPPARFDTSAFLLMLAGLSALSLVSFVGLHNLRAFDSERVPQAAVAKEEEAEAPRGSRALWAAVMSLTLVLNALSNGVLPSVQSYSCMPYGVRAYHLATSLAAMANPAACLAGVWLRPASARLLAAVLAVAAVPLAYLLAAALLSPAPPLHRHPAGEVLIVVSWVWAAASVSYARLWVCAWARRGGAQGMRLCGAATQLGSALGSLLLFVLVTRTALFTQPAPCPTPSLLSNRSSLRADLLSYPST
ncbi:PREDICTED: solute carrier family 52, riboflavin transporter, member 3 isoform X1 [Papilio xuthus]|uniref:Riboflavin transporter n=2 Tax=Papilio xuthus TaxID=66420 RepID=A0AAJ6ZWQ2_PAPXU|nr:PREDICTED: solute carrier family 52, riboflavin transporter, member 3 isoform X1 [Papilio xuthus]XP_013180483.1 PREDICTED: solute carrier family 52, riboflavin transporter, member 3 isoform X1 [Papilio xuthus]XP_013180492.1 PREDICTED: solute carrier family 52, riboflavin transporter, member 3 isoform X1 [Papilio xuthus]